MNRFKTITKRRQLTLPKDIAAHLNMSRNDQVELTTTPDGDLLVRKINKVCRFCGSSRNVIHFGDIFVCHGCAVSMSKRKG